VDANKFVDGNIVTAEPTIVVGGRGPASNQPSVGVMW